MLKRIGESFKKFGQAIGRSCYDMDFYREKRTEPWSQGLLYFLRLMTVVSIVTALFLGPVIYGGMSEFGRYIGERVPDGASVTLSQGQLSAALDMPLELSEPDDEGGALIIDTTYEGLDFPRDRLGEDGLLVGRDAMFLRQNGFEERTYNLKEFPDFSVNKNQVLGWIRAYTWPLTFGLSVGLALIFFLGVSFGNVLFVLFGALVAMLMARVWRVRLEYREWLSVSFYAVTLPIALGMVFDSLGWTQVPVFPVVFFMIIAAVVADERARSATSVPPPTPPSLDDLNDPPVEPPSQPEPPAEPPPTEPK
jgi:hypothetical protein